MSTTDGDTTRHDAGQIKQLIQENYAKFQTVPRTGPFIGNCVDLCGPQIRRFEERGFVKEIGYIDHHRHKVHVWELESKMSVALGEYDFTRSMMPCGHAKGFTNERETIFLRCNECDGRFTAEEVAEYRENNDE